MEITLNLPETVESRFKDGTVVTVDVTAIPEDKLAECVAHWFAVGISKTVNDAASGAKAYAEENGISASEARAELAGKKAASIERGEFTVPGTGYDELDLEIISILIPEVKGSDEAWWKDADIGEKRRKCMEHFATFDEAKTESYVKVAKKRLERKAEEKARKAEEAAELAAINVGEV